MAELVELIQYAEKHDWPVAGGMLDQSENFRQCIRAWKESISEIRKNDSK